ncbi:MAG: heme-binding domain-containing protein [Deinococcales bacterium]
MKTRKWTRVILIIIAIFLLASFALSLALGLGRNPPVIQEVTWDSPQTRELAQKACFDCHSNETKWPIYSYIPPFSLFIARHVQEGREKLNFSEWLPGRNQEDGEEAIDSIREGEMPLPSYLPMHSEARLNPQEKEVLAQGLLATLGSGQGGEGH